MLFTHFYLTQGQKIETWFVSPASKEYFDVEPTIFCQKIDKKSI